MGQKIARRHSALRAAIGACALLAAVALPACHAAGPGERSIVENCNYPASQADRDWCLSVQHPNVK